MKRIIIMLVTIAVLFCHGMVFAGDPGRIIAADLSKFSVIDDCGFTASSEYKKSGDYTLKWAGSDLYRDVVVRCRNNWEGKHYLEMWLYSAGSPGTVMTIMINADNPETTCMDYYHTSVKVSWTGWRMISIDLENDLTPVRMPMPFSEIKDIRFSTRFEGNVPASGTILFLDRLELSSVRSPESFADDENQESADYVLADFSRAANIVEAGFVPSDEQHRNGDVSLKWAGEDLKRAPKISNVCADWTPYRFLEMWIYSEKATGSKLVMGVCSENPTTDGNDYYYYNLMVDWTGWKQFLLPLGTGSFQVSRSPLGWNQVTGFEFWPGFGNEWLDPSTVLYLDRIALSNGEQTGEQDAEEYIIPAEHKEGDIDIADAVKMRFGSESHPRMLMTAEDFKNLKSWMAEDPYVKKIAAELLVQAETYLDAPIQKYEKPDGLVLPTTAASRIPVLAMAYRLSGDTRFAERAWTDMETVCRFPDWNPAHFLDIADTVRHVALGYDWLYDYFDQNRKRIIRNAIVKNAFGPSMDYFRKMEGFTTNTNNWNQVINSGLGMAALAVADDPGYEELANEVVNRTFDSLPIGTKAFAPDGACPEGPAYWGYTQWGYFQYVGSLVSATGDDYGLAEIDGMKNTGYFPIHMTGPTGKYFNFADAEAETFGSGALFFLSAYHNQPELGNFMLQTGGGDYTSLMYYRKNEQQNRPYQEVLPCDMKFDGQQSTAAIRSSWSDKNASFVAFKGGDNQASHGDMDIGSFVFETLGYRWFVELGREDYNYPGMWDFASGGGRWNYYRKRAEGQNTLVINPGSDGGQYAYAKGDIYKTKHSEHASYGLIDLSEAYQDQAVSAKRGIALVNNRSTLLVQDEIKTKKASEIYSFFHTQAKVEVSADKKSAVLDNGKDQLQVKLLNGEGAELGVMEATPLPGSPGAQNTPNPGIRKLYVHLENAVNPTVSLAFIPVAGGTEGVASVPEFKPLNSWDAYLDDAVSLQTLTLDGMEMPGFAENKLHYLVDDGLISTVGASAESGLVVDVAQAQKDGDVAEIRVSDIEKGQSLCYTVAFRQRRPGIFFDRLETYPVKQTVASAVPQEANTPENSIDGDLNTRWSADGEQWIRYDLGESKSFQAVLLAFMNGNQRESFFDIAVSEDAVTWKTVFSGRSSGASSEKEAYWFEPVQARYVQITGYGNSVNNWNSITEFAVPILAESFLDTDGHWAKQDIEDLANAKLIQGVGNQMFAPDDAVTRAEFTAMVCTAANIEPETYSGLWSDVENQAWYAEILQAAQTAGLLDANLYPDGAFRPEEPINRMEMCAITVAACEKILGIPLSASVPELFSDLSELPEWGQEAVRKGVGARLMNGLNEHLFAPDQDASRAQAAVVVKRLLLRLTAN